MAKVKKYQKGGCLSTTGSGTRTSIYKSAAGEGGSSRPDGKAARQFARAERKMDKAQAKMDREEAAAKAKAAPKGKSGKSIKKYQVGGSVDPKVAEFLKKRQAADTSKPYNREDMIANMNKQIMSELKNPKLADERRRKTDSAMYADWQKDSTNIRKYHEKEGNLIERRPSGSMKYTVVAKKSKAGSKLVKKAKSGGSFPDLNKDGKITQADILKGRGVIKNGAALKKQAAKAIAMKKAGKAPKKAMVGKKMMGGGKCKNGC
jgi:hypothetical protein